MLRHLRALLLTHLSCNRANELLFASVFIFIIFGQTQSLFTPGLCAVNGVDRH